MSMPTCDSHSEQDNQLWISGKAFGSVQSERLSMALGPDCSTTVSALLSVPAPQEEYNEPEDSFTVLCYRNTGPCELEPSTRQQCSEPIFLEWLISDGHISEKCDQQPLLRGLRVKV